MPVIGNRHFKRWTGLGAISVLAALGAACGTRQPHADIVAAASDVRRTSHASTQPAQLESALEAPTLPRSEEVSSSQLTSAGVAPRSADRAASSATAGRDASRGGGAPGASADRSVVKVASVGTLSGPAGSTLIFSVQGLQVWNRYINARGGVNGHPVRLTVADDGADPSRHRALIQQLVERDHVIAFLNNTETITGAGSVGYLTSKRVPVIGSETGSQWFYESPMYFPQATSGRPLIYAEIASTAQQSLKRGMRKLGTIVCQEATTCTETDQEFGKLAPQLGMQRVYRATASLAQPDFTAECLAARNAGTEVILLVLDTNSLRRIATACARQQFRPLFAYVGPMVTDNLKNDPNLANSIAQSNVFPYFQNNTPATREFSDAVRRFGAKLQPGPGTAQGWVTGKLFERAAQAMPEPPTSAAVLDGLWSLRDESLGGLTAPMTFTRNKPAPPVTCWFNLMLDNDQWKSADNATLHCR